MRKALTNRIKVDGLWYWYEYKDSWGKRYYSFDAGSTWHKSKREAWNKTSSKVPC